MRINNIDHFVITTADLQACLDFYVGTLGMEHRESNGHHNLYFPGGKISIHTKEGEFQPAALNPSYGSQDFCLIVEDDLENVQQELAAKGIKTLAHIVERHGAHGTMRSLYVRDPDGNLVELSNYCQIVQSCLASEHIYAPHEATALTFACAVVIDYDLWASTFGTK